MNHVEYQVPQVYIGKKHIIVATYHWTAETKDARNERACAVAAAQTLAWFEENERQLDKDKESVKDINSKKNVKRVRRRRQVCLIRERNNAKIVSATNDTSCTKYSDDKG